jgi:hypothetical protein
LGYQLRESGSDQQVKVFQAAQTMVPPEERREAYYLVYDDEHGVLAEPAEAHRRTLFSAADFSHQQGARLSESLMLDAVLRREVSEEADTKAQLRERRKLRPMQCAC